MFEATDAATGIEVIDEATGIEATYDTAGLEATDDTGTAGIGTAGTGTKPPNFFISSSIFVVFIGFENRLGVENI